MLSAKPFTVFTFLKAIEFKEKKKKEDKKKENMTKKDALSC